MADTGRPLSDEALEHYNAGIEAGRLTNSATLLEMLRTQELLQRYLPPPPAVILDVGGGTGIYALWLALQGYEVHLIDAVPLHVEQVREASRLQADAPLASIELGDARHLTQATDSVDAVLLFGPLYHLIERPDRIIALQEANRVVRRGGVVMAVVISRFASALDGLFAGMLADPEFARIVEQDLHDGQHRNPTNHPHYFTTAYFHYPSELQAEIEEAGLEHQKTLAIEGPGWISPYVQQHRDDPQKREQILSLLHRLEEEPGLMGMTAHIMSVARKS